MITLSDKEILMINSSSIGPIDLSVRNKTKNYNNELK